MRTEQEPVARALTAIGLAAAGPAVLAELADWSEQHEQQLRVGVVHSFAIAAAITCYAASLATARPVVARALRLAGWRLCRAAVFLGGHLAFRLAGGANHAEAVRTWSSRAGSR